MNRTASAVAVLALFALYAWAFGLSLRHLWRARQDHTRFRYYMPRALAGLALSSALVVILYLYQPFRG